MSLWKIFFFFAVVGIIGAFLETRGFNQDTAFGISFTLVGLFLWWAYYLYKKDLKDRIYNAVNEHYDTLCIKREHSIYYDDYGNEICDGFAKELIYFVENVIFPNKYIDMDKKFKYAQMVGDMMNKVQAERPRSELSESEEELIMFAENSPDPYEFEGNCKKILEKAGWSARTTPKSGDQGVDVIAKKDDILIVVQCKFYTQPVGNKAVQEILAGKTYYKADYAVVVTNNTYTKSAKQLAKTCGVVLLNIKQLKNVDEFLE